MKEKKTTALRSPRGKSASSINKANRGTILRGKQVQKVLKDNLTEEVVQKKKPTNFKFSLYENNIVDLDGFNPNDFAESYNQGDYESSIIFGDIGKDNETEKFIPLKVKVAWFKEIYPNGHWEFSDIYTVETGAITNILFVDAFVWKDSSDVSDNKQHIAVGVGHANLATEPDGAGLLHSRALNKALASLGFDVPVEGPLKEVVEDTEVEEKQPEPVAVKETPKTKQAKKIIKDKNEKKDLDSLDTIEQEREKLLADQAKFLEEKAKQEKTYTDQVKEIAKEKLDNKKKLADAKKAAAVSKPEEQLSLIPDDEVKTKSKTVKLPKKKDKGVSASVDNTGKVLLPIDKQLEDMRKVYTPTLEEALDFVIEDMSNSEKKTIRDLMDPNFPPGQSVVTYAAKSGLFLLVAENSKDQELINNYLMSKIAAEKVYYNEK